MPITGMVFGVGLIFLGAIVLKFNVRLILVNEPPNPRDQDEVIMYEAIQQMQEAYDQHKEQGLHATEEEDK